MTDLKNCVYHEVAYRLFPDELLCGNLLRVLALNVNDSDGTVLRSVAQICEGVGGQVPRDDIEHSLIGLREVGLLSFEGDPSTFDYDAPIQFTLDMAAMRAWPAFYKSGL